MKVNVPDNYVETTEAAAEYGEGTLFASIPTVDKSSDTATSFTID